MSLAIFLIAFFLTCSDTLLGLNSTLLYVPFEFLTAYCKWGLLGSVEEFVSEPFVIRKLGSDTELVDSKGKGRSGALYLIPKKEQTPNGTIAPIQLSIAKLDTGIYGEDIELGSGNKVNSIAELAYKLLVGEIKLAGAE